MKAIPVDLAEQVRSIGIDASRTERLAAIYHRSLARRAAGRVDATERRRIEDLVPRTRRLAPAAVHFLYKGSTADTDPAEVVRWLDEAGAPQPTEVYSGPRNPLWLRDGLQEVLRSLDWGEEEVGSVVTDLPDDVRVSLRLARQALSASWADAWTEHNTLVQYLVFTRGPLRSATIQSTYGVVYAELDEASDPLRMFELLLHESAHHALALREQFTRFLDNPDAIGAHALRPDARPLRGVLHAAFVMCRLAEGLSRYLSVHPSGGPLDGCPVQERRRFALDSLREALNVLDSTARWTGDGHTLRASMGQCLAREGVPS
ncbi:aKG-HExxH-type peptide beta-hydroxylase [Streptomyces fagopyri]|uniref:aKG-HExxH-type peptide beta-hydroxylase n=1 Tax=Streptomyces fagopyri TaxID=2662397 RepID=UPI0033E1B82F